jgi:hypothetical protein
MKCNINELYYLSLSLKALTIYVILNIREIYYLKMNMQLSH